MSKPCLIVVHGLPATGKTTVSTEISKLLQIPVFAKDNLKEAMFDTLGYSDKARSAKVSHASHRLLDLIIKEDLRAGRSVMVEGNFKPAVDSTRFQSLRTEFSARWLQLLCWAEGGSLYERFQERETSPDRHPAHVHPDYSRDLVRALLAPGKASPLQYADETIEVNTSDFSQVDYPAIVSQITSFMLTGTLSAVPAEHIVVEGIA